MKLLELFHLVNPQEGVGVCTSDGCSLEEPDSHYTSEEAAHQAEARGMDFGATAELSPAILYEIINLQWELFSQKDIAWLASEAYYGEPWKPTELELLRRLAFALSPELEQPPELELELKEISLRSGILMRILEKLPKGSPS